MKKCASFVSYEDCLKKLSHHISESGNHQFEGRTHRDIETAIEASKQFIMVEEVDASWFMDHLRHPIVHPRMPSVMLHNFVSCTIEIVVSCGFFHLHNASVSDHCMVVVGPRGGVSLTLRTALCRASLPDRRPRGQ